MSDFIVGILNVLIKALGTVLSWVFNLFPPSPFQAVDSSPVSQYLGGLAWVLPINQIVAILEVWIACIGVYFMYSIVARWIKVIA